MATFLPLCMAGAMILWTIGSLVSALLSSDTTQSMTETIPMATADLPTRINRPAFVKK